MKRPFGILSPGAKNCQHNGNNSALGCTNPTAQPISPGDMVVLP
jgi:hypothetical protein